MQVSIGIMEHMQFGKGPYYITHKVAIRNVNTYFVDIYFYYSYIETYCTFTMFHN